MRSFKSAFGIIGALLPVGYCGGLLYYFHDVSGETGPAATGLGPTMLGLGGVGILFFVPLLLKLVRLFAAPGEKGLPDEAFDADAALARYLARKAAGELPSDPAPRTGFGRKIG